MVEDIRCGEYYYRGGDTETTSAILGMGSIPSTEHPVWVVDNSPEEIDAARATPVDRLDVVETKTVPVAGGISSSIGGAHKFSTSFNDLGVVLVFDPQKLDPHPTPIEYTLEFFDDYPGTAARVDALSTGEVRTTDDRLGGLVSGDGIIASAGRDRLAEKFSDPMYADEYELFAVAEEIDIAESVVGAVSITHTDDVVGGSVQGALAGFPGYSRGFSSGAQDVTQLSNADRATALWDLLLDTSGLWAKDVPFYTVILNDSGWKDSERLSSELFEIAYDGDRTITAIDDLPAWVTDVSAKGRPADCPDIPPRSDVTALLRDYGATEIDVLEQPEQTVVDFQTPFPGEQPIRSGIEIEDGFVTRGTIRYGVLDKAAFTTGPHGDRESLNRLAEAVEPAGQPGSLSVNVGFGDAARVPRPHVRLGWRPGDSGKQIHSGTMDGSAPVAEAIDYIRRVGENIRSAFDEEYVEPVVGVNNAPLSVAEFVSRLQKTDAHEIRVRPSSRDAYEVVFTFPFADQSRAIVTAAGDVLQYDLYVSAGFDAADPDKWNDRVDRSGAPEMVFATVSGNQKEVSFRSSIGDGPLAVEETVDQIRSLSL